MTVYRMYRGGVHLTSVSATGHKDTATDRGVVYTYWVTAVNAVGERPPSNTASARAT